MSEVNNLTGQRFGRLLVIRQDGSNKHKQAQWLAVCDCDELITVVGGDLKSGRTRSCGCRAGNFKHGLSPRNGRHLYLVWRNMVHRCTNPTNTKWKDYGGRGIKVCERWMTVENWFADLSCSYQSGLTLDRIDVNGNYEPGNVRWATRAEQVRNRRITERL